MRIFLSAILLAFCSITLSSLTYGQVEDTIQQKRMLVITTDGVERVGYILSDDGREILLETKNVGKIYILKSTIKSIEEIDDAELEISNGDIRTAGPFTTRYYFTTNALPIKKRDGYAIFNLYGPEAHIALNSRFSVGIMTTWIGSPFVAALKYTIPTKNEKLNFGFGTLFGTSGYLNEFRGFGGLHWGMVTYGNRLKNITFSAGFSYLGGFSRDRGYGIPGTYLDSQPLLYEVRKPNMITMPVFGIGGITKIGKKVSFIFDAMAFFSTQKDEERDYSYEYGPGPFGSQVISTTVTKADQKRSIFLFMPGMRFQSNPDRAFQFVLAGVTYTDPSEKGEPVTFPVPMCSWFVKF